MSKVVILQELKAIVLEEHAEGVPNCRISAIIHPSLHQSIQNLRIPPGNPDRYSFPHPGGHLITNHSFFVLEKSYMFKSYIFV